MPISKVDQNEKGDRSEKSTITPLVSVVENSLIL